ncbi:hypothetical protein AXF24_12415 [Streptococcus pneumoniae]|uniref:hypothetical protein n=2 Tax=Streptococcus pneumoniae TaxID=1313 RepID=UPI000772A510|nr:hypothetical protein AWW74_12430 [Streptococcus pneumoniae]KXB94718.1 hypothetical protein AXF24_12415 [Streptococcus pneumoniae]
MSFKAEFHISEEGYVRWNSNENIPFDDVLEKMHELGWITLEQSVRSSQRREVETEMVIQGYREYRRKMPGCLSRLRISTTVIFRARCKR